VNFRASTLLFCLLSSGAAVGQGWGTGQWGSQYCPQAYGPAAGAVDGSDEVANLQGRLREVSDELQTLQDRREEYKTQIATAQDLMGQVLSDSAIAAVSDHYEHRNDAHSYRAECLAEGGAAATESSIEFPDADTATSSGSHNDLPPPPVFCIRDPSTDTIKNTWLSFAKDNGYVSSRICNYLLPGVSHSRDREDRRHCREGLAQYYEYGDRRCKLDDRIARLKDSKSRLSRRLGRIQDEIAEGTYCAACAEDEGEISTTEVVLGLAAAIFSSRNRQTPPPIAPYGYPNGAYPGPLPGYMNVGPGGYYGTAPGSVGAGAFNCAPAGPPSVLTYNTWEQQTGGSQTAPYSPLSDMILGGNGPGWNYSQNGVGAGFDPNYGYVRGNNPNMLNMYDGRYHGLSYAPTLGAWNGFGYRGYAPSAPNLLPYMGPGYGPGVNGWGGGWNSGYNYNGRFGSPPAILPYMGGPSIYNVPGTTLNPLPSQ